jgi:hypothetical protein
MTPSPRLLFLLLAALLVTGCQTTERITQRSRLVQAAVYKDAIDILATDSTVLHLTAFTITDSGVIGRGSRCSHEATEPFDGPILFSDMLYIERESAAGFKTVLALGAMGFVAGSAISILNESAGSGFAIDDRTVLFDPRPRSGSSGGGHSCPTLYSWNGTAFSLDGEAFGVAWGKALEMTTCTLLPSLRSDKGFLRVQVRNERPETHYHNQLTLLSAETPENTSVVIDTENRLLALSRPVQPEDARTEDGHSVRRALSQHDSVYWQSSLSSAHAGGSFRDMIDLQFLPASGAREGTLIVNAINTDIFSIVLSQVSGLLGDATLEFIRALENDPEVIRRMQLWQEECSLRVMVWSRDHWREAGRILPEANAVPFTRAVTLDLGGIGDTVHIRLECLADVWKIDAISLDRTPPRVIPWSRVPGMISTTPGGQDVAPQLGWRDERRIAVLPSQTINLVFPALPTQLNKERVYALEATGYLHEWMPSRRNTPGPLFPASHSDRITYLKMLLAHRNILLPAIYSEWRAQGSRIGREQAVQ